MRIFDSPESLEQAVGERVGASDWLVIDQTRVDQFAEATGDDQWIHVDPVRAEGGPFGGTIAHGFLTLALLVPLSRQVYAFENRKMALNYGVGRVRFPAPVPVGSKVRASFTLGEATRVDGDGVQVTWQVAFERDGSDRPVCVAESLMRVYF